MGHYLREMRDTKPTEAELRAWELQEQGIVALEKTFGKDGLAVAFLIHSLGKYPSDWKADDFERRYESEKKSAIEAGLLPKPE